jgi:hypothetical protein
MGVSRQRALPSARRANTEQLARSCEAERSSACPNLILELVLDDHRRHVKLLREFVHALLVETPWHASAERCSGRQ